MENMKIRVTRVLLLGEAEGLNKRIPFGPETTMYTASAEQVVAAAVEKIRATEPDFEARHWVLFEDRYVNDEFEDCVLLAHN